MSVIEDIARSHSNLLLSPLLRLAVPFLLEDPVDVILNTTDKFGKAAKTATTRKSLISSEQVTYQTKVRVELW
jgi:hypothetical protein